LPLATFVLSAVLRLLSYVIWILSILFQPIFSPFLAIIPVFLYILSPLIVSSKVLLDLFVILPYRTTLYTSQALYPIYAFLGVACISGAIIGFGARQIVLLVGWGLLGDTKGAQRSESPPRARPQKRPSATARGKRRVRTEE
jgi:hypothetical protein